MAKDLFHVIGRGRGGRMCVLAVAMFFAALLETLGISMVVAACSMLVDEQSMAHNALIVRISHWIGVPLGDKFIICMLLALMALYLFKVVYLLAVTYVQSKFVRSFRHDVSCSLFESVLRGPYELFTKTSAASISSLLGAETAEAARYLTNFLQLVTEGLVMLCIGILLLLVDPVMTLFVLVGIGFSFLLIRVIFRKRAYRVGLIRQQANARRLKWLHQGVQGVKDVKAARRESFFCENYEREDRNLSRAESIANLFVRAPALCLETILVICVLMYMLFLLRTGQDVMDFLPSISALVLVALRMLPCCSRINSSLTQMNYTKASFETIADALRRAEAQRETPAAAGGEETELAESLAAENVTFRYDGREEPVLKNVDIGIPAGMSVGIVGPSGAGKTTLVDILLGLLKPQQGRVLADGKDIERCYDSYLRQVAYIPQNTFLMDDTIRSNVALGVPPEQIDDDAVWRALEQAALAQFVRGLPEGLDTQVGEGGIRLSGGERQRVGIARALYRGGKMMIFDEATSALDPDTEASIIQSIQRLRGEKTLLIISHRRSAVEACDMLYRVDGERVRLVPADRAGDERPEEG